MIEVIKKYRKNVLVRNYFKIFSIDVIAKSANIILLPVFLKLMTQEEYGLYGYLISIIGTFSLVFNLGLYVAQSKLYHDYSDPVKKGALLFTINVILIVFILIFLFGLYAFDIDYKIVLFLFKTPVNYNVYRPFIALGIVVSVYSLMLLNFFLTSEKIKMVQFYNVSRILLVNGTVLGLLYYLKYDSVGIRLKYSNIIEGIIIILFLPYYFNAMKLKFDFNIAIKALKISFPILVSAIIGIFINLSDRFFLEKYGTLKDLSIYNLSASIASVIPFVFAAFQNVWLPQFLKEKDVKLNKQRTKKMVVLLLVFFAITSIAIMIALKTMLVLNIIDKKYEMALPLLPLVLTTCIITSITPMFSNHFIYMEKLYLIIIIGIPFAAIGVMLNIKLVPLYNVYGAAISSLIVNTGYLVSYFLLSNFYYKKLVPNTVEK